MNTDRKLLITVGVTALFAALLTTYILFQPSAEDLLVQALEAPQDITAAHAVVNFNLNAVPQDSSATFDLWFETSTLNPIGSFRMEVLEAGGTHAEGTAAAFNGETLVLYNPAENKVLMVNITDVTEALEMLQDMDFQDSLSDMLPEEMQPFLERFSGEMGDFDFGDMGNLDLENFSFEDFAGGMEAGAAPTAEEIVADLLQFATVTKEGREWFAGEWAYVLRLEPNAAEIPPRLIEDVGHVTLWIGNRSKLPLGIEYSEGEYTYFSIMLSELEINKDIDDTVFTIDFPSDAEIITLADLQSGLLGTNIDGDMDDFILLTPVELPAGATLVETIEVHNTIVQRYTLKDSGKFTIAMGVYELDGEALQTPDVESIEVELRGTTGQLFEDTDNGRVLLTWIEGDTFFSVAGDLTSEQALAIAESLE